MRLHTSAIAILLAALVQYSHAQGQNELLGISPTVLSLAKAGVSQDLIVNLDATNAVFRLKERSQAGNQGFPTQEDVEALAREFSQMKKSLFPDGKLGRNRIVKDFSHLPTVLVEVPDLESLVLLVKQPQVKSVHENQSFRPPGA